VARELNVAAHRRSKQVHCWNQGKAFKKVWHPCQGTDAKCQQKLRQLQIAAFDGDLELAKLLLTVPNDLSIKDAAFQATAMGWAHHFQRTEITALIERHRSVQARG